MYVVVFLLSPIHNITSPKGTSMISTIQFNYQKRTWMFIKKTLQSKVSSFPSTEENSHVSREVFFIISSDLQTFTDLKVNIFLYYSCSKDVVIPSTNFSIEISMKQFTNEVWETKCSVMSRTVVDLFSKTCLTKKKKRKFSPFLYLCISLALLRIMFHLLPPFNVPIEIYEIFTLHSFLFPIKKGWKKMRNKAMESW